MADQNVCREMLFNAVLLSVLRKLLCDIRRAQWFSLILDEATDVSHKEHMVVCIRWVDKGFSIHEVSLEFIYQKLMLVL